MLPTVPPWLARGFIRPTRLRGYIADSELPPRILKFRAPAAAERFERGRFFPYS